MARGRGRPPGDSSSHSSSIDTTFGAILVDLNKTHEGQPRSPIVLGDFLDDVLGNSINSGRLIISGEKGSGNLASTILGDDSRVHPITTEATDEAQSSEVIKPKEKAGMALFFHKESCNSEEIEIEMADVEDEIKLWQFTLMGNVIGLKPTLKQVWDFVSKHWGHIASPIVQYYRKGWFSFRFSSSEGMNSVLKEGPWQIGSNTLVLKQWSPTFSVDMEKITSVPVWVLFPGLDPYLWSDSALSKIASKVGKPFFADLTTTLKSRLSFARVMVEVDVSKPLLDHMFINSPFVGFFSQPVEYEWVPHYCSGCGKLGHLLERCKWNKKKVAAKQVVVPTPRSDVLISEAPVIGTNVPESDVLIPDASVFKSDVPGSDVLMHDASVIGSDIPGSVSSEGPPLIGAPDSGCQQLGGTSGPSMADTPLNKDEDSGCVTLGLKSLLQVEKMPVLEAVTHSECAVLGPQSHQLEPFTLIQASSSKMSKVPTTEVGSLIASNSFEILSHEVYDFLRNNRLDVFSVLETRVKESRALRLAATKFKSYGFLHNYKFHGNGRIWVLWDPCSVSVVPLDIQAQHIHCKVTHHGSRMDCYVTFVYASNASTVREVLWGDLLRLSSTVHQWLVLGDFNVVRDASERISDTLPNLTDILDFNRCILDCSLDDLRSSGCDLTWTNNQEGSFPSSSAHFHPSGVSDHSPCMVTVLASLPHRSRFSFLNCWISAPGYLDSIRAAWDDLADGTPMYAFFCRLKSVRKNLLDLHKRVAEACC
ncbi:hypothetical protein RND81_11G096300 [Saponaria officinalis]|uniref:DUF4283 domain-containing protein n=1 Tax=Saponaria officinalis TaxID=3572 RepID=A0AAW1HK71_SAPOF